jgi:hypothetical protein
MNPTPRLRERHTQHAGKVSDKWSAYLDTYQHVFSGFEDKPVALLEIGVQNGGSLEVWSNHFPNATHLVGCDIDPLCAQLRYDDQRVSVVVGDSNLPATEAAVAAICPAYDIVIDDGSHRSGDIVRAFARYFPRVKTGGVFATEDLHCSYWQEFEGGLFDPLSSMSFFKRLVDLINHEHWGVTGARGAVLRPFFERYGCAMDEDVLASIHSVEFYNSICVVRKHASGNAGLGDRLLAGKAALVSREAPSVPSRVSVAPPQQSNRWSQLATPPEEESERLQALTHQLEQEIVLRQGEIDRLEGRLRALQQSHSWRFTAPLRALSRWVRGH